jgi:vacuolar-type H+-ATPase subunit I/STV1
MIPTQSTSPPNDPAAPQVCAYEESFMPETNNLFQDGVERVREAADSIRPQIQRVQRELKVRRKKIEKRFETGRKDIEKRLATQRKDLEKRLDTQRKQFEKRTQKLRNEIEKYPAVKRFETIRKDATKQLEQSVSTVLHRLQIASKSDLDRIDRKISLINKQMKQMGRRKRPNGAATTA